MGVVELFIRFSPVAVGAPYFALSHFGNQPVKRWRYRRRLTYTERLISLVVELQHDRVGLTAIYAGIRSQVVVQPELDTFPSRGARPVTRFSLALGVLVRHGVCIAQVYYLFFKNIGGGGLHFERVTGGVLCAGLTANDRVF